MGCAPKGRIDYNQFGIDADGETLYWTPDDKTNIPITATRGSFRFLELPSLAIKYGESGTNALRRSLGLTGYKSGTSRLRSSAVKALRQADKDLPGISENIEIKGLTGTADGARCSTEQAVTSQLTARGAPRP